MPDRQWDYDARVHQYAREGASGNGAARAQRGHAHSEASTGDAAAATNRTLRRPHLQSEPNQGRFGDQELGEIPYRYELTKYLEVPRSTSFNQMLVALIPCLKDY